MRLSLERTDPGYHREAWRAEIFLNGERVLECVTADEETGEVVIAHGGRRLHGPNEESTCEVKRGAVTIRLVPRWRTLIERERKK